MTDSTASSGATANAPPSIVSYLLARLPSRITWKALAIAILGLALLIPLGLIHTLVWERQGRFDAVPHTQLLHDTGHVMLDRLLADLQ